MQVLDEKASGDRLGRRISNSFLAIGLFFGLGYVIMTPPLRVPDEASHFFRAYTTSKGSCVGTPAMAIDIVDWGEMDERHIWRELPENTTPQQMVAFMRPPAVRQYDVGAFAVGNVYNCVPYVSGAAGIATARLFTPSPLILMYAGRVANLLSYLLLLYIALQLLPAFQLLMIAIALMPMALHQAGSLSADNLAISLSCLFIAYVLKLALGEPHSPLTRRQLVTLAIMVVALALCKTLLFLCALLVLVPAARFKSVRHKWLWIGAWFALAASTSFGWQAVNRVNLERVTAIRGELGIMMSANLHYIFSNPLDFLEMLGRTLSVMRYEYLEEFVGKLGFLTVGLPAWVVWTYLAALILIAIVSYCPGFGKLPRALFASLSLINFLSAFVVVWTFETPTAQISPDSDLIHGVQGRYLIPFGFPLFAAISAGWLRAGRRWVPLVAVCVVLTANSVALHAMGRTYYSKTSRHSNDDVPALSKFFSEVFTPAPSPMAVKYDGKLVRRTGSTTDDHKVYFVTKGEKRWVVHGSWIIARGFAWPQDVSVIPADEFDDIPDGDPIGEGK